jgi:UPF0755 protein
MAVIAAVLAIAVIVAAVFAVKGCMSNGSSSSSTTLAEGQTVEVTIPTGASGDTILSTLMKAGVITNAKDYYAAASKLDADSKMKPGTYEFTGGMTAEQVVQQLIDGPNTDKGKVTIPEGLTVEKTAAIVEQALGIKASDFIAEAKASNFVDEFPFLSQVSDDSLEGFLAGKTYDFAGQTVDAHTVIEAMLKQFQTETASIDMDAGIAKVNATYGLNLDEYDIIKLASIIEREAVTADDKPLVSSVFYNRLAIGMALQSDATMGYVTGGEVTADDLKTESPYNTYLNTGLPPTPICSPSVSCIEAALNPASTDYYYFFIVENGSYSKHAFSETYEQHQAVIAESLAEQKGTS